MKQGINPAEAAELTPAQLYAAIYDDKPAGETTRLDPIQQLHVANHQRAESGLPPVFPELVKFNVPRVKR